MRAPTATILTITRRSRLASALVLAGCLGEQADPSPLASSGPWHIDPQPVVAVGKLDGPVEYLFGSISSVFLAPTGHLVAGDRQNSSVRVFDREGRFVRQLGRSGEGPGEFRDVAGVWLSPPDTVHVLDLRLRRITRYALQGDYIGVTALDPTPRTHADHYAGTFADGSIVVGTGGGFVDMEDANVFADEFNYWRYGGDGQYLAHITGLLGRWWYSPTARERGSGVPGPAPPGGAAVGGTHALSPRPRLVVHGDSMYFADQAEPAVKVLANTGVTVRSIPLPPSDLTEERARALVRQALENAGDERGLTRLDVMPRLSRIPQVFGLLLDTEGLIWTSRYDPARSHSRSFGFMRGLGEGGEWWIVDRAGRVRSTVTMPDDFLPMQVYDSLIVGITVDAYNVEGVAVYRLTRGS